MSKDQGNTKTLAERLKAALLAFQGEPVKFASAKLADGTAINIQGDSLAAGVMITVMTEAGEAPLPDGEYTLEDGTVFYVSGGSVSEVKAPEATAPEGMEAAPNAAPAAPSPTQIIERIEKEMVFEKVAKVEELEKKVEDLLQKFAAVEAENKSLKSDNVKFSKMVTEMSESLIAFGEMPQEQAPKKTEPIAEKKSESIEEFRARVFNKK